MKRKLKRFWRQITADKKKFGLLATCVAVGLLLWGRLMLLEDIPRIATADPEKQEQVAASTTSSGSDVLPPLQEVRVELSDRLALDLFAFRHNRYTLLPPEEIGDTGVESANLADDVKRDLTEKARGLILQSVIPGPPSSLIMINARVLRVGDSIDGFEVVSIGERTAKVARGGLIFSLQMSTD